MSSRRIRALLAALVLAVPLASCKGGEATGTKEDPDPASVKKRATEHPKLKPGTLPPLRVGAQYRGSLPPKGGTYGLKPPLDVDAPTPKHVWVHRVKRLIPGTTLEQGKAFAAKLGLPKYKGIHKPSKAHYFEGPARSGFFDHRRSEFRFYSDACKPLSKLSMKELKAIGESNKLDIAKAKKLGLDWLKSRGFLPSALDTKRSRNGVITHSGAGIRVDFAYDFEYRGRIEGWECCGPGAELKYKVLLNGKVSDLTYSWTETERLGQVECRTKKEAWGALNRGHAGPVSDELRGGLCDIMGYVYYAEGAGATHLQPCFKFLVRSDKGGATYYIPMAKAKYFKGPKKQVVVLKDIRY